MHVDIPVRVCWNASRAGVAVSRESNQCVPVFDAKSYWPLETPILCNYEHGSWISQLMTLKPRDRFKISINDKCREYEVNKVKGLVAHFTMRGV